MGKIIPSECRFIAAADRMSIMPPPEGYEIAFWGRSNVGKSSLLNALMGRVGLARASKNPGRTQAINFYQVHPQLRFVDLPGYGYANVPIGIQKRWDNLLASYFQVRDPLLGVYFLVDSRRGLGELDHAALKFLRKARCVYRCVLTKMDKVPAAQLAEVTQQITATKLFSRDIIATSSRKKEGIALLREEIEASLV